MALSKIGTDGISADTAVNGFTPTESNMAGRNRIINGAMVIDQRNAGAAVTPAAGTYLLDRWYAPASDASKLTYQQVADAPAGFKFSTKITVSSSATPASYNFIWQPIEGFNVIDLGFGAAGAQTIAVSFWIKGSVAGNYSAFLGNNAGRSYLVSVPVTTSWAYQTVSITGDTSGTWLTTNAAGMYLGFDMGSEASRYSTAGSWLASNVYGVTGNLKFISQVTGSTLNITGVQLEAGSVATPFEHRLYGQELALCHRYCYVGNSDDILSAIAGSTTGIYTSSKFPTTMRANPSAIASGTIRISDNYAADYTANATVAGNNLGVNGGRMFLTGFSGITVSRFYAGYDNGTGGKLIFAAEL